MAAGKTAQFLSAKQAIRRHPDWTDKQVAEDIGEKLVVVRDVITQARRDVAADTGAVQSHSSVAPRPDAVGD